MAAAAPQPTTDALLEQFRPVLAQIAAGAEQREAERVLPFEPVARLNELRFGALLLPVEAGGRGASWAQLTRLLIELAAADSNVAHVYRSHFGFVASIDREPAQQALWYPRVAAGEIVGNAATERGRAVVGTAETTLVPRPDGSWSLTGEKFYSTGSIFADWIQVTAQVPGEDRRSHAFVRAGAPGVELRDDWDGFGQRLTGTGTSVFTDVVVPADHVRFRDGSATQETAVFQLVLLAVQAGIAQAAVERTGELVAARTRGFSTGSGVLFREDPLILQLVGQLSAKAFAARATVLEAARELDAALGPVGRAAPDEDPVAVTDRCELAVQQAQVVVPPLVEAVTGGMFDVLGASAVSRSRLLDRYWRNARTVATHNPTVFKARIVGDHRVNGTPMAGLTAIGEIAAAGA